MAQSIILKRSALQGKVPTTSTLNVGELAINTYDGKIYVRQSGSTDTVQEVVTTNTINTGSINLIGNQYITGSLGVSGDITVLGSVNARQFNIGIISSSILYTSGSTKFGDTTDDTMSVTGSLRVSGSTTITGSTGITGSLGVSGSISVNGGAGFQVSSVDINGGLAVKGEVNIANGAYVDPYGGVAYDLKMGGAGNAIATRGRVSFDNGKVQTDGSGNLIVTGSLRVSGSTVFTGSVTAANGFTGSLFGTASFALNGSSNAIMYQTASAASTWVFNHFLATPYPVVTVYDNNNSVIIPQSIVSNDSSSLTITFSSARTGVAVASKGGYVGSAVATATVANALTTARLINGTSFDGTQNITIPNLVSGSTQISLAGTSDYSGLFGGIGASTSSLNSFSASTNVHITDINAKTASFETKFATLGIVTASVATTGSNIFRGNQTITGSLNVSGSFVLNGVISGSSDMVLSGLGSTTAAPRLMGISPYIAGNAAQFIFGDTGNAIQNANGGLMQLVSFHGMQIYGGRYGTATSFNTSVTITDPSLNVIGTQTGRPTLVATAAGSQTANIQEWRNSGNTPLASISSAGLIVGSIGATNGVVSGSSQVVGILSSLNTYTGSNDTTNTTQNNRLTNLETTSASVNISVSNINSYTASVSNSIQQLSSKTGSYATTGSNSFIGNQTISGSLTIGSASVSTENTLLVGPAPAGGAGEGGQILLAASGGLYTSASMLDNYQNKFRVLKGTNAGSDSFKLAVDMGTGQVQFPNYNSSIAFTGSAVGYLAVDNNGNILTATPGTTDLSQLNSFTASAASRLTNLETTTASLNISVTNLNSYSTSVSNSIQQLNLFTSSTAALGSLNAFTASTAPRLTNLETTSASVNISVSNLNSFTASNANTSLNTYTGSISDPKFVQIGASTSSLNNFTSSLLTALTASSTNLTANGNLTVQGNLIISGTTTTINSQTLNIGDNIIELNYGGTAIKSGIYTKDATGGSLISGSFLWDATNDYWIAGISGSESRVLVVGSMGVVSGSTQISIAGTSDYTSLFTGIASATSSLNSFTSSAAPRLTNLETTTASLNISVTNLNSYSASVSNSIGAINAFSSSENTKASTLATYTGSVDTKFTSVAASTSSLNSFTSSAAPRLTNLETTSASVNVSITNLNSYSASVSNSIQQLSSKTGSYATTGSNTFIGNQTISGSINVSGSLTASLANGYTWVGNGNNVSTLVATSSFGGAVGANVFDFNLDPNAAGTVNFIQDSTSNMYVIANSSSITFRQSGNTFLTASTGSLNISASFTASLQNGYTWVGNGNNVSTLVSTSSFGGGTLPSGIISGSSQLSGTTITDLTIVNLTTINETASVIFSSGSNRFGDAGNDIHSFTGSVQISGSLTITGSVTAANGFTGSLLGTASFALNGSSNAIMYQTASAASTWVFNHFLATPYPVVTVYDNNNSVIIPQSITANDSSSLTITFSSARTGVAVASKGGYVGSAVGTATTANALTTGRLINNTLFDGTQNITIPNLVSGSTQISLAGTSDYSGLFGGIGASTSSLNSFSASTNVHITDINAKTASFETKFATLGIVTASVATTGSNIFRGNQTITGSLNVSGSLTVNGLTTLSGSLSLSPSQSAFLVSHSISQSATVGATVYGVNITPLFTNVTSSQIQTALRVMPTFTGSFSGSNTTNIIADFGATSVGSQFTITDAISGSIYMVNDISGLPIIEALSDGQVNMYDFPYKVFNKSGSYLSLGTSLTPSSSVTVQSDFIINKGYGLYSRTTQVSGSTVSSVTSSLFNLVFSNTSSSVYMSAVVTGYDTGSRQTITGDIKSTIKYNAGVASVVGYNQKFVNSEVANVNFDILASSVSASLLVYGSGSKTYNWGATITYQVI